MILVLQIVRTINLFILIDFEPFKKKFGFCWKYIHIAFGFKSEIHVETKWKKLSQFKSVFSWHKRIKCAILCTCTVVLFSSQFSVFSIFCYKWNEMKLYFVGVLTNQLWQFQKVGKIYVFWANCVFLQQNGFADFVDCFSGFLRKKWVWLLVRNIEGLVW